MPSAGISAKIFQTSCLPISFYLRSPICLITFKYGVAQFPKVIETFVLVAVAVDDLEGCERDFLVRFVAFTPEIPTCDSLTSCGVFFFGK